MPGALERVAADPISAAIYKILVEVLNETGSHTTEPGNASVLIRNGRAFLGVHPRRGGLRVNVVLDRGLSGTRLVKVEQVSRHRYHNEVLLAAPADVDAELAGWIREARALTEIS